jgi:hypothetical protein
MLVAENGFPYAPNWSLIDSADSSVQNTHVKKPKYFEIRAARVTRLPKLHSAPAWPQGLLTSDLAAVG